MKSTSTLRTLAVVGFGIAVVHALPTYPLANRQFGSLLPALLVGGACVAVLLRLFPGELRTIASNRDLLVPYGIVMGLQAVLNWAALFGILGAAEQIEIMGMAFSLSATVILSILIWTLSAAWTTCLVVASVSGMSTDPALGLERVKRCYFRVLLACACSITALFAVLAVALSMGATMPLAVLVIGGGCLTLNLATMGLLPVVVTSRLGAWDALRAGIETSWSKKREWLGLVLVQWALLGGLTYFSVSFRPAPGTYMTRTSYNVNGKWLGGYETETNWYVQYCNVVEIPAMPPFALALAVVFMVLAIAIKLRVVSRLY